MLKKTFLISSVLLAFQSCQQGSGQTDQNSTSVEAAANVSGLTEPKLEIPDSNRGKITVDVRTIDKLKSITLTVDGKDAGKINKLPFEIYYDGTLNIKAETLVKAVAINIFGGVEVVEKRITNIKSENPDGITQDWEKL